MRHNRRARGVGTRPWKIWGGSRLRAVAIGALLVGALAAPVAAAPSHHNARAAQGNPFQSRGMWIWMMSASNGGKIPAIIARARRYAVTTLYIKSGDGSNTWAQFNPTLVSALHAAGLQVCGWQYVYGNHPLLEANVGANTVRDGADCLVIDAEAEYEGKYLKAQRYVNRLRQLIGASFPVALAGLPYIDYHPSFPYSVFLGPSGAQYNLPQMYWVDIGTSVDHVYAHTYIYNRIYQRPIDPLGQVYNRPPPAQIRRFRQFQTLYGASGVSWWDWQEASRAAWRAVSTPVGGLATAGAVQGMARLAKGAAGDLVVWAQEHLSSAGENVAVDGGFGLATLAAVKDFQYQHGLIADGVIGTQTWTALLTYQPATVSFAPPWRLKATRRTGRLTAAAVAAADTGRLPSANRQTATPLSALLPDTRHEIPGSLGAGRP